MALPGVLDVGYFLTRLVADDAAVLVWPYRGDHARCLRARRVLVLASLVALAAWLLVGGAPDPDPEPVRELSRSRPVG